MGENPSHFNKGTYRPVEQVSLEDVQKFIERLNGLVSKNIYRLSNEAEWEYACMAGSNGAWCFGDNEGQLDDYAWYSANS